MKGGLPTIKEKMLKVKRGNHFYLEMVWQEVSFQVATQLQTTTINNTVLEKVIKPLNNPPLERNRLITKKIQW